MKLHILSVSGGTFKNDNGESVDYGSIMVIDDEIQHRDGFSGQEVRKMKADPHLIHTIKNHVPALFECEITVVGKDSKIKILGAKKIDSKIKAA